MKPKFLSGSIARRLLLIVGFAASLVLGLAVWVSYRASRAALERQTRDKAIFEIHAAVCRVDDFIARIGMLPRATACRQMSFGRDPDPGMVPFMAQLLSQVPEDLRRSRTTENIGWSIGRHLR